MAVSNLFNFQPFLPVPVRQAKILLVRPVFRLITSPTFDENCNRTGSETGFGDIQVFSLYGPDKKGGLIWGIGLSFVFPTASSKYIGIGKFQMGPAAMALSITKNWTLGAVVQHWRPVGGDPSRPDTKKIALSFLFIVYIYKTTF